MHEVEQSSGISRRTVVAGTAWGIPAIMAASAVPAFAASNTVTTVSVQSILAGTDGNPEITFRFATNDSSVVKSGTSATFSVTVNPSNNGNLIDPAPNAPTGLSVSNPASFKGTNTFTVTVNVTSDVTSPSTAATITLNNFPGGTVSAYVASASAAPGNGTATFLSTPVTYP